MGRRATGFPPMARDRTGRLRVQWGPRLTSGSGAPSFGAPATDPRSGDPAPRIRRSVVRLPLDAGVLLAVTVNGIVQQEDVDYLVAGRLVEFRDPLVRESRLRRRLRALRRSRTPTRTDDRVDVWLGSPAGVVHLRDLPIQTSR